MSMFVPDSSLDYAFGLFWLLLWPMPLASFSFYFGLCFWPLLATTLAQAFGLFLASTLAYAFGSFGFCFGLCFWLLLASALFYAFGLFFCFGLCFWPLLASTVGFGFFWVLLWLMLLASFGFCFSICFWPLFGFCFDLCFWPLLAFTLACVWPLLASALAYSAFLFLVSAFWLLLLAYAFGLCSRHLVLLLFLGLAFG